MSLGSNLQYLRKMNKITQEQFAERMSVSRQTISRWETDEVYPEMDKLLIMCSMFNCTLDNLVRENMAASTTIYSEIEVRRLEEFKMARYVIVSPNPEDDVNQYMMRWGQNSGLLAAHPNAKLIGWDFPFVSQELQNRFRMRGYVAAYVIPEGFTTECPGVEYAMNKATDYAVITVTDPFAAAFERIPNGYKKIMEYLEANNFKERIDEQIIPCFEYVYEKDGVTYMEIYVNTDSITKTDAHSQFE